ncbi:MAG: Bd3614 family nucleic acid deaminase [Myxococcota bacterium]
MAAKRVSKHPWVPDAAARAWMAHLSPAGEPRAAVLHEQGVWWATSVFELVEGIWALDPDGAHAVLRSRVLTNRPVTPLDRAVVHLCGRKIASVPPEPGPREDRPVHDVRDAAQASRAHHQALSALDLPPTLDLDALPTWLRPAPDLPYGTPGLRTRDRPVSAVLVDAHGQILEAARNTHGRHRLHHAEVNLVQRWEARGAPLLPRGSTVFVGLQCCRMCAALLASRMPEPLPVYYLDPEPGPFGRNTALQALGVERPLTPSEPPAARRGGPTSPA